MEEKSFWQWYTDLIKEENIGALITPTMAGRMLGTTRQYIQNLINNKKIRLFEYDGMKYVGISEITELIVKRQEYIMKHPKIKRIAYIEGKQEKKADYEEMMMTFMEEFIKEKGLEEEWNKIKNSPNKGN